MTHKEVKSSIHRQILMVFFLPLGMAALHIAMAFPMVKRLLALFSMTNSGLFARCTVVTLLVFALGLWRDLWADSEGLLQDCREKVRIQGIIVEFISVKCYNERAWEAKTVSQALCVTTEETGGNLS